jgi:dienelactone hydrolase
MKHALSIVLPLALALALLALGPVTPAGAAIQSEEMTYSQDGTELHGVLYYDDAVTEPVPGILVVHEWWGLNDYAKSRAMDLAGLGYVAFALDMFGEGKTTTHPEEASQWSAALMSDQAQAAARFNAAYDLLKQNSRVDGKKIGAIGYCFGGSVVLTMAMQGADLAGVVSFHGGLPQEPAKKGKVKAQILVCHGGSDPFATDEQVQTFMDHLKESGANWEMIIFGGAKHSFTNPQAGKFGIEALAYNKEADIRSWEAMSNFFAEIFGE